MDGWIERYMKHRWMVEWMEKNMKKQLDGWMDRKNRKMVGWI